MWMTDFDNLIKHGDLHTGYVHPYIIEGRFRGNWYAAMRKIRFLVDEYHRTEGAIVASNDIGKIIGLLDHIIFHDWRDPVITSSVLANAWNEIDFFTGGKRLIATSLTRPNPSDHLPALLFCRHGADPGVVLEKSRPITEEQDLRELFRNAIEDGDLVQLIAEPADTGPCLRLGRGIMPWNESDTLEKMRPWLDWIDSFRPPTISMQHDTDVVLSDDLGFWQRVRNIKSADYHLEIYRPMRFHLEDLLPWMDLAHGTFEDIHGRFCLKRTDGMSGHKYISVRH